MSLVWHELAFPVGVEAESVAALLRLLAGEQRRGLFTRQPPVVIETELRTAEVRWRVGAADLVAGRLQRASEMVLPGLRWTPGEPSGFTASVAVALRVRSRDRLLAVDQAEPAAGRLLDIGRELRGGEGLLVQWQIGPWLARSPVRPATVAQAPSPTLWSLADWGQPDLDSEQVMAARKKVAEPVLACMGRLAVCGAGGSRARRLLGTAEGALQLLRAPGVGVSRRFLPSWWVAWDLHHYGVSAFDPPCRLTAAELAGVVGWPLGNPRLRGVTYRLSRTLPLDGRLLVPGEAVEPGDRVVGESAHPSQAGQRAVLRPTESLRHLHVIGPTGVGKSTLLARLVLADIRGGRAVVAIDPKGDLVDEVLARLPRHRDRRVVVLDPTDVAPVGLNPLTSGSVGVDGLLHVLRSIWSDAWGPRLGDVLHAGLLTLSLTPGHSLAELPRLLTDADFRRPLRARAVQHDPVALGSFWPWYEGLSPDMRAQVLGPVMSRLRALLLHPDLRAVLGQTSPRFDLRSVFTERACLLVRLPKGQLGSEGARLLGSVVVAQLWRLVQGRAAIPAERRHPVALVLDEFQEFLRLPLDLADVLAQARSLGLGLTLAHQYLGQLDPSLKAGVLANAGSRVAFRLDVDDGQALAKRTGGLLGAEDFGGLEPYEAYASLLTGAASTAYGSLRTLPLGRATREISELVAMNRERFGVARATTEANLRWGGTSGAQPSAVLGGRPLGGSR